MKTIEEYLAEYNSIIYEDGVLSTGVAYDRDDLIVMMSKFAESFIDASVLKGFELGLIAAVDDCAIDYDAEVAKLKNDIG